MIHATVPGDGSNRVALVEIGLTGLELLGLLKVLPNVLDKDFGATTSQ